MLHHENVIFICEKWFCFPNLVIEVAKYCSKSKLFLLIQTYHFLLVCLPSYFSLHFKVVYMSQNSTTSTQATFTSGLIISSVTLTNPHCGILGLFSVILWPPYLSLSLSHTTVLLLCIYLKMSQIWSIPHWGDLWGFYMIQILR